VDRYRYIYVFPRNIVYDEYRPCYQNAAARIGRVTIEALSTWSHHRKEWMDPDMAIIFWGGFPKIVPVPRRAKCVVQYIESVGDPKGLILNQRHWLEISMRRAKELDLMLVGTPEARDFWLPFCRNAACVPIGYDPIVMGTPDWTQPKIYDVGFCGTPIGRREWILPILRKRFGPRFLEISGFGQARNAAFDRCRTMLYIGHSNDIGVGLRLWQAVSTSAVLITEDRSLWPAEPGRHCIVLPPAAAEYPDAFVDSIERALQLPLEDTARTAHEEISQYTVERCMRDFMMPAVLSLDAVPAPV